MIYSNMGLNYYFDTEKNKNEKDNLSANSLIKIHIQDQNSNYNQRNRHQNRNLERVKILGSGCADLFRINSKSRSLSSFFCIPFLYSIFINVLQFSSNSILCLLFLDISYNSRVSLRILKMYVSVLIIPQVGRVRINMDSKISFKSLQYSFNMRDRDRISVSSLSAMCGSGFFPSNSRHMTVILSSFHSQILVMFNGLRKTMLCYGNKIT